MEFEEGSGTAITCTLSHPDLTCPVSLDFSPVLRNILPLPNENRWQVRNNTRQWPDNQTISTLINMGVSIVPVTDFHWKISMTLLEVKLMKSIRDNPWSNGCRRKSHRIMKKLNEVYFCNPKKPVICSYVLKVTFFFSFYMRLHYFIYHKQTSEI